MKRTYIFVAIILLLNNCAEDEHEKVSEFVFGVAYGFCVGNCAHFYQLKNDQLFEDDMDMYLNNDFKFKGTPLSGEKFEKAKLLSVLFPPYLTDRADTTFGCPDCADQGGYHLTRTENGITHFWHIDTNVSNQPVEIRGYMDILKTTLEELK